MAVLWQFLGVLIATKIIPYEGLKRSDTACLEMP